MVMPVTSSQSVMAKNIQRKGRLQDGFVVQPIGKLKCIKLSRKRNITHWELSSNQLV